MSDITCETCGSVYRLTSEKVPYRDKDKIDCDVCGKELYSWNESHTYETRLLRRGTLNIDNSASGQDITDRL